MKQHLQDEIEKSTIYSMLVTIDRRFNLKKMSDGKKDSGGYYHKMQTWYVEDMTKLIGNVQNETLEDGEILLAINGKTYIERIFLSFDAYQTGEYKGIYMIMKRKRKQGSEHLTQKQLREARTIEINALIMEFSMRAAELGYLV